MDTKVFCVYNQARGVFLSSKVTVADNADQPLKMLKVLVSGLALDAETGFWLSPLHATPSVPRLFPFDLVYLDQDHQVVDSAEVRPGVEFPLYRREVVSALVLPLQTVQSTQTARGDRLIIGLESEIEGQIGAFDTSSAEPVAGNPKRSGNGHRTLKTSMGEETVSPVAGSAALLAPVSSAAIVEPESGVMVAERTDGDASENSIPATKGPLATDEVPETASKAAANDTESLTEAEAPVIAITEVVLERETAPVINGQHGGVEDLFSNWVDAPLLPSVWIARNAVSPGGKSDAMPLAPDPVKADKRVDAAAPDTQLTREGKPPLPAAREKFASVTRAGTSKEAPVATPLGISGQTRPAIPQQPLAETFTVAQYGLWRMSTATAVSPPLAAEGHFAERPAASVGKVQSNDAGTPDRVPGPAASEAPAGLALATTNPVNENAVESPAIKPPVEQRDAAAGRVSMSAASAKALTETIQNAISRVPEVVAGASGQTPSTKGPLTVPDKVEKLRRAVPAAGTEGRGAQSAEAMPKKPVNSKETAPRTLASKQPEKKGPASTPQSELSLTLPLPGIRKAEQKEKLKISIQRVDANGKAKEQPLSLGMRFKRWLNPVAPANSDRRKAHRRYVPGMIAYYYTGGAPKPHEVADISMTGFYLVTEDRWMPETMIQMTLQKPCARGERKQSITVLSKIVRRGSDGVAAQFVMPESLDPASHDVQPSQTTDRFALARFL